jgi:hypothetical protein
MFKIYVWLFLVQLHIPVVLVTGLGKLPLAPASTVILDPESHRTHDYILVSHESGSHATLSLVLAAILLLVLTSTVILGSESHGNHDCILVSDGSQNLQTTPH